MSSNRYSILLRLLASAALGLSLLVGLGDAPIHETDEGFAANRARTLNGPAGALLSYDLVDDYAPQFKKPALLYSMVAASYRIFGYNEFAARLPTALCAFGFCLILVRFLRRYADETVVWIGMALCCSIPFVRLHMRTAMLEFPFLFFSFLAIHLLCHRPGLLAGSLAGLACGAATLVKGAAGGPAFALAVLTALVIRTDRLRCLRDSIAGLVCLIATIGVYFWSIPEEWRETAWSVFISGEASKRQTVALFGQNLTAQSAMLISHLGFIMALSSCTFIAIIVARRWRKALLVLVVTAPTIIMASLQVTSYPRYLLAIYPFLCVLAVSGVAALSKKFFPKVVTTLVAIGLGWLAQHSSAAAELVQKELRHNRPEILELARRIPSHVREGNSLLFLGSRLPKCHRLLFYGQRPIESLHRWMHYGIDASEPQIVLTAGDPAWPLPVQVERLESSGEFSLYRVRFPPDRDGQAVVRLNEKSKQMIQTTVDLLALDRRDESGFAILIPPTNAIAHRSIERIRLDQPIRLEIPLEIGWSAPRSLAGLDLGPIDAREAGDGLVIEMCAVDRIWHPWVELPPGAQPDLLMDRDPVRIMQRSQRMIRIRKPVPFDAIGIRVKRIGPGEFRVGWIDLLAR